MAVQYMTITSSANPIMKGIREMQDKKGRMKHGTFLLEGQRLVEEAASSGADLLYYVVSDSFARRNEAFLQRAEGLRLYKVPDELFARVSETETPQGIIAVARMMVSDPDDILPKISRCILLENVQDPGNIGTIIRTADACGFDAVVLSKGSADPYNPKVLRSTMGSLFHLPIVTAEDLFAFIGALKGNGIKIAAAHPRDAVASWNAPLGDKIAVVIGNEGNGLSERMLQEADIRVRIPMPGKSESLNASAAAAMLLYESMRQKQSVCPRESL